MPSETKTLDALLDIRDNILCARGFLNDLTFVHDRLPALLDAVEAEILLIGGMP